MNGMKRLFIALPIADASRTAVYRGIISAPALRDLPVSRTGYANLHLTLQFLGDTDEKRVPELKKIIDALPAPESAQSIHFTHAEPEHAGFGAVREAARRGEVD